MAAASVIVQQYLHSHLTSALADFHNGAGIARELMSSLDSLPSLPIAVQEVVRGIYSLALATVFKTALACSLVAVVLCLVLSLMSWTQQDRKESV